MKSHIWNLSSKCREPPSRARGIHGRFVCFILQATGVESAAGCSGHV